MTSLERCARSLYGRACGQWRRVSHLRAGRRRGIGVTIISLASEAAFHAVTTGTDILDAKRSGTIVVDTCTLAIADKAAARDRLKTIGVTLLDCTVSGTRPAVLAGNLTLYASGDAEAFGKAEDHSRRLPDHAGSW